jgi:peroxiredoxin
MITVIKNSLLFCALLSTAVAQEKPFKLDVKGSEVPAKAKVFIRYMVDRKLVLDSIQFEKNEFHYKGNINEPTHVSLFYSADGTSFFNRKGGPLEKIAFYVDPTDPVTKVKFAKSFKQASVKSGLLQEAFQKYSDHLANYDQQLENLSAQRSTLYNATVKDDQAIQKVLEQMDQVNDQKSEAKVVFIRENPSSYFSLLALNEVAGYSIDVPQVEPLYLALSSSLRGSALGTELGKNIEIAKTLGIGKMAPDFAQLDPDGKTIKLSDFRGKYVLLDFWASWCVPCRAENPNLVKAYAAFKSDKFDILGVSLDKEGKREAWLKAVEKDGLTWPQVSDLKGWSNEASQLYSIKAIPQNYLIGPDGKIVAINLKGEQLTKKLQELLK